MCMQAPRRASELVGSQHDGVWDASGAQGALPWHEPACHVRYDTGSLVKLDLLLLLWQSMGQD